MRMMTKRMSLAGAGSAALLALAAGGFACVGSEESPPIKDGGGAGATPDAGNGALDSGQSGDDDSGGNGPDAGSSGADSGDASSGCTSGALQCSGAVPQVCMGGVFRSQAACSGAKPLCSNGLCGSYIVTGGVRSTVPAGDAGTIRLVEGAFEVGARTCTSQGLCVTGGIVP